MQTVYLLPKSICGDFEHLLDAPEENDIVAIDLESKTHFHWKTLTFLVLDCKDIYWKLYFSDTTRVARH